MRLSQDQSDIGQVGRILGSTVRVRQRCVPGTASRVCLPSSEIRTGGASHSGRSSIPGPSPGTPVIGWGREQMPAPSSSYLPVSEIFTTVVQVLIDSLSNEPRHATVESGPPSSLGTAPDCQKISIKSKTTTVSPIRNMIPTALPRNFNIVQLLSSGAETRLLQ